MTSAIAQGSLGRRLQERRKKLGASPAQMGRWSGLEPGRLAEMEAGGAMLPWEYEAACRALAVDAGVLARGEERSPTRSVARFRSADFVRPAPDDLRLLSLAAELGRIGGALARELGRTLRITEHRDPTPISGAEEAWRQGYRLGERARGDLTAGAGPIVELEKLLFELGIHVARFPFSTSELDAASLWERGSLPVLLLNTSSSRVESTLSRRALLAHELCHLLHDASETDVTTQLTWSQGQGNWHSDTEKRARAFAPAFLAPREEVRHWFRAGAGRRLSQPAAKVEELARRWGFSWPGAVWHAKSCQIITSATAESLAGEFDPEAHPWEADFEHEAGARGAVRGTFEWASEVADVSAGLLADLVIESARSGVVSEGRAREILTWS